MGILSLFMNSKKKTIPTPTLPELKQKTKILRLSRFRLPLMHLCLATQIVENVLYSIVTLYVPTGRKKIYEATEAWNLFSNIVEFDPSGIDAVGTDTKMETARYSLNGNRIAQSQRGLNIIRMSDGTVRKVFVK